MKGEIDIGRKQVVFIVITLLVMAIYIGRLFSIQIIDNYVYSHQADEISRRKQIILTRRGEIFDRNFDQPLATNVDVFTIMLDLSQVPADGLQLLITKLSRIIDVDEQYLWNKIPATKKRDLRSYKIWNGVTYRQIAIIAERMDEFPGISWESSPVRYYPQGNLLAHVLGYTGEISSEELQILYNQGYASAREIGKTGIEKYYDNILRGDDGIRYGRFDARGRRIQEIEDIPPQLGNSLVLTIDRHIQLLTEKALGERTGGAVVLEPSTGKILAMASYPNYNPNIFSLDSTEQKIAAVQNDPRSPLLNRAIQSADSPASTFKILMSVAALQEKEFNPLDTIHCSGSTLIGNRVFHCHQLSGHGSVNLYQALAQSCNIYFYSIGKEYLGINGILDTALKFGLGEINRVDLPGEVRGLLPSPEWKKKTYNEPWVLGDTVNLSIGQGFLTVTPLQLANITAGTVNNGIIYQPYILSEVRDQTSLRLISKTEPRILIDTGIAPEVFEVVREAMRFTITNGTPREVITSNATEIIGKTGTAETNKKNLHSWFTAYVPANEGSQDEGYVIVVWVDASNEWEWWAPKAANLIIHGITHKLTFENTVRDLQPLWYLSLNDLATNQELQ